MDLAKLGNKLYQNYRLILTKTKKAPTCFIGFDGFTDQIISVVEKIKNKNSKSYISTIKNFGLKIVKSSDKSCNFELVTKRTKLGGNGPILTEALLHGGHEIRFAGAIGTAHKIEPIFKEMAKKCKKVYPLAPSGKTEALEFKDGKIILGHLSSLDEITYENLIKQIDKKKLLKILENTDLLISANWTMIEGTTKIWNQLLKEIAPQFQKSKLKFMFVDLADPSKRSKKDLLEALGILQKLNHYYQVILALNRREAEIISQLLNIKFTKAKLEKSSLMLFQKLKISKIIIHHATFCLSQSKEQYCYHQSFYSNNTRLKTGAGDNFNAGYCNALLLGFSEKECLIAASATASFYVTQGKSPSIKELKNYLSSKTSH